ncbi:MAG: insulinase family protein, partial [Candidatus Sericytochromatia bacterium]|nr:insulinase family protein [Candidatus Tanganyikabacteria bacterium]
MRRRLLLCLLIAFASVPLARNQPVLAANSAPAGAGRDPAVPIPARFSLSNGLPVLLVERHDLPIVALQLVLRTGSIADPPGKTGVASLTSSLLTKGAGGKSAEAIADALDFVGASLDSSSDYDKTILRLSALRKDLDMGLGLFADALLRPAFAAAEVERERDRRLAGLKSLLDDPNRIIDVAANQGTYASFPYGRLEGGTTSSLGTIADVDLKAFYDGHYRPDNGFLVVVGDVTRADLKAKLEAALGAWSGKAAAFNPPAAPGRVTDRIVRIVDLPEVTQTYIQLENIAIKRNDPDFVPANLMTYILGGGSVARLYKDIRDVQGLAYGAYCYLSPRFYAGKLTLELQTKIPSTDRALSSLLDAMKKMRDAGPTEEEMTMAKDYFTGSFSLRLESNSDLAREVTNQEFYGLGDDYLAGYRQRIRAVTRKQVHEAARKFLTPSEYALTIVTKASEVESRLA